MLLLSIQARLLGLAETTSSISLSCVKEIPSKTWLVHTKKQTRISISQLAEGDPFLSQEHDRVQGKHYRLLPKLWPFTIAQLDLAIEHC